MRTLFCNTIFIYNDDTICIFNRCKPVSDN